MISRKPKPASGALVDPESASAASDKPDPPLLAPLLLVGALAFIALFAVVRSLSADYDPPCPRPRSRRPSRPRRPNRLRSPRAARAGDGAPARRARDARGRLRHVLPRVRARPGRRRGDARVPRERRPARRHGDGVPQPQGDRRGPARVRASRAVAVWITSKVAPGQVRDYDARLAAVESIVGELGVERLDLLLIHSPKLGEAKTVELWRALVEAKRRGRARAIGVSNFNWAEVEALERATGELPGEPDPVPPVDAGRVAQRRRARRRARRRDDGVHEPRRRRFAASTAPRARRGRARARRDRGAGAPAVGAAAGRRGHPRLVVRGAASRRPSSSPPSSSAPPRSRRSRPRPRPTAVRRAQGAGQVRRDRGRDRVRGRDSAATWAKFRQNCCYSNPKA